MPQNYNYSEDEYYDDDEDGHFQNLLLTRYLPITAAGGCLGFILAVCICCPLLAVVMEYTTPAPAASVNRSSEPLPGLNLFTSPTPTPRPLPNHVKTAYLNLFMIQGGATMIDETARQVQAGQLEGPEAFGSVLAIGMILNAINENLDQPSPALELDAAWAEARVVIVPLRQVLAAWVVDQQITAAEVPARLQPLSPRIEQMLILAEESLAEEYGISTNEIQQFRAEAQDELRRAISEPSSAPGEMQGQ